MSPYKQLILLICSLCYCAIFEHMRRTNIDHVNLMVLVLRQAGMKVSVN